MSILAILPVCKDDKRLSIKMIEDWQTVNASEIRFDGVAQMPIVYGKRQS